MGTRSESGLTDYVISSFSGLGTFRGVAFDMNTDANGVRYMNFSYNSVSTPVPAPAALGLFALALAGVAVARRRAA